MDVVSRRGFQKSAGGVVERSIIHIATTGFTNTGLSALAGSGVGYRWRAVCVGQ